MRIVLTLICVHCTFFSFSQSKTSIGHDTSSAAVKFLKDWEKDFLDIGVSLGKDSFHINDEAKKLLVDSEYRRSTYPDTYSWPVAIQLMNKMDLKKAFWHIINLYRADTAHRELALQTFVLYDSLVDMEKILTNTFYTYALTDPQVCIFKSGKPSINRPDILESKLGTVKEITEIVKFNRKSNSNGRKS
jgi:hypothetical protein